MVVEYLMRKSYYRKDAVVTRLFAGGHFGGKRRKDLANNDRHPAFKRSHAVSDEMIQVYVSVDRCP